MRMERNVVNIIFDAGKGSVSVESREGVCGELFGELPHPVRSGYDFDGWYLDDQKITADTVLTAEADVTLTARWIRLADDRKKKRSVMSRQRICALALAISIVFLAVALAVANRLVAIYHLTDTYLDATGQEQTERFTIRREDGVYKMFDRSGKLMETTENGYTSSSTQVRYEVYVAETSGNQYLINTQTGEYETYAIVDYDSSIGESLGGTVKVKRVMMFPRVGQDNTYSITVTNEHGGYKIYRKNVENTAADATTKYTTTVHIEGTEETLATYDPTLFATICVACGYTLSQQKLDFNDPQTPRNPDGSVRYEDYGLTNRYDADGNLTYSPAVYTIVKGVYAADGSIAPGESYTVTVGDAILSDGGYYAKLEGRDAVYILGTDLGETVLQPKEAMVTPATLYPMTASTFPMVFQFRLGEIAKLNSPGGETTGENANVKLVAAFDYIDLAKRENTMFSTVPYWLSQDSTKLDGYQFNGENVSTVLTNLYQMQYVACRMLNPTEDADFEKYPLLDNVYLLTFKDDTKIASGGSPEDEWVENILVISQLQKETGTYFMYSALYDMIVEVDQYYLSFLEWEQSKWYSQRLYQNEITYVKDLSFTLGDKTYDFTLDNRFSYAFYDNGDGTGTVIDLTKGTLAQNADGSYSYTISKTGAKHNVIFMDLTAGRTYVKTETNKNTGLPVSKIMYKSETGIEVEVNPSTRNMHVYCAQYQSADGSHRVDYTITDTYETDSGGTKTKTYSALENFKRLYGKLLYYSIMGDVNEKELGSDIKSYIASHDPTATISYSLEDMASIMNPENYTENNKQRAVIRLYQYTERKMLLTIEVLDENGTPDPTKAQGEFYVLADEMTELMQRAEAFLNGKLLPSLV